MIKNLTPHEVRILLPDGGSVVLPPSGVVARCSEKSVAAGVILHEGIEIPSCKKSLGEVADLPEAEEGVTLLVSAFVRSARADRTDLVSPGDLVRNEAGQPVGCRGLVTN